jgi:hypothetical protein
MITKVLKNIDKIRIVQYTLELYRMKVKFIQSHTVDTRFECNIKKYK